MAIPSILFRSHAPTAPASTMVAATWSHKFHLKRFFQCVHVYSLLLSSSPSSLLVSGASRHFHLHHHQHHQPFPHAANRPPGSLLRGSGTHFLRRASLAAFVGTTNPFTHSNSKSQMSLLSRSRYSSSIASNRLATAALFPPSAVTMQFKQRQTATSCFTTTTTTTTSTSSLSAAATRKEEEEFNLHPIATISDTYDGGNGEFVSAELSSHDDDECDVRVIVDIRPDPYTEFEQKQHFQSFSFRSTLHYSDMIQSLLQKRNYSEGGGDGGENKEHNSPVKVKYIVQNAGQASYAPAWKGSSIFVTTKSTPFDPDSWGRTSGTMYDEDTGCLSWIHEHELNGSGGSSSSSTAYFAYFPPYSYERHLGLVARCAETNGCQPRSLGQTISGREIDCLTIGTGPRTCWIIHRQHPGESMAEFYAEGLLHRLLGMDSNNGEPDEGAKKAREMFTFHIVPNINPDGSANGYLRTNAAGSNLNREWAPSPAPLPLDGTSAEDDGENGIIYEAPTLLRSPEVYNLLRHMDTTGCDSFLDIHGDEALPFNFLAGSQGMTNWGKRLESLHGAFLASYERANPDMQCKVSYDPEEPNEGMRNVCSNQIALRFDCFSGTLEMPFKEISGGEPGWGPERARKLGASVLDALCYVSPYLRDKGEFWKGLPEEDEYVHPSSNY